MSEKWKVGEKIEGRYEIHYIKRGGMGIVFLCYDHETKSPVAIKTFQDKYLMDKDSIDRFMWEAETWVRLEKHKNIVRANYVKNISGRPYIFLEFVPGDKTYGSDLRGWIWGNGLDLNTTLNFAIQFCLGMEHAEKKFKEMGKVFVHRDIKPENIMITQDKVVKITDFGLVKAITGIKADIETGNMKDETTGTERFGFSKAGSISGTPPYMSPEQCRGDYKIDIRSDIYAFGCVLYEMLTGRQPFICTTFYDYRMHHLMVEPKHPVELSPGIPKQLNAMVMKCLEKEPSKRYQDFKSLKGELSEMYFQQSGERIEEETPQELEAWEILNEGASLGNLGKSQEAIDCFDRALEISPRLADAWYNKGFVLKNLGKLLEAIDCFDRALEINPRYADAWYNKGNALYNLNMPQEALAYYDKVVEINPRYADAWLNKGTALAKLDKPQEAIACYDRALRINPRLALAWSNKGVALGKLGKFQDEIACYDKALEINPRYADTWYGKGLALFILGKSQEAIDAFQNFIKFALPKDTELVVKVRELIRQLKTQLG